ncbi:hypothetical protein Agub_g5660, partial [Astrephomene gubernaculifera]
MAGGQLDADSPFHADFRTILALIIAVLVGAVATAAGVGGGAIYIPLFNALVGFALKPSTALSQACITAGSLAALVANLPRQHPAAPGMPLVDFGLMVMLTPVLLVGVGMGVLLNVMLPSWLLTMLLLFLLLLLTAQAAGKGLALWRIESQRKSEAAAAEAAAEAITLAASGPLDTEAGLLEGAGGSAGSDGALGSGDGGGGGREGVGLLFGGDRHRDSAHPAHHLTSPRWRRIPGVAAASARISGGGVSGESREATLPLQDLSSQRPRLGLRPEEAVSLGSLEGLYGTTGMAPYGSAGDHGTTPQAAAAATPRQWFRDEASWECMEGLPPPAAAVVTAEAAPAATSPAAAGRRVPRGTTVSLPIAVPGGGGGDYLPTAPSAPTASAAAPQHQQQQLPASPPRPPPSMSHMSSWRAFNELGVIDFQSTAAEDEEEQALQLHSPTSRRHSRTLSPFAAGSPTTASRTTTGFWQGWNQQRLSTSAGLAATGDRPMGRRPSYDGAAGVGPGGAAAGAPGDSWIERRSKWRRRFPPTALPHRTTTAPVDGSSTASAQGRPPLPSRRWTAVLAPPSAPPAPPPSSSLAEPPPPQPPLPRAAARRLSFVRPGTPNPDDPDLERPLLGSQDGHAGHDESGAVPDPLAQYGIGADVVVVGGGGGGGAGALAAAGSGGTGLASGMVSGGAEETYLPPPPLTTLLEEGDEADAARTSAAVRRGSSYHAPPPLPQPTTTRPSPFQASASAAVPPSPKASSLTQAIAADKFKAAAAAAAAAAEAAAAMQAGSGEAPAGPDGATQLGGGGGAAGGGGLYGTLGGGDDKIPSSEASAILTPRRCSRPPPLLTPTPPPRDTDTPPTEPREAAVPQSPSPSPAPHTTLDIGPQPYGYGVGGAAAPGTDGAASGLRAWAHRTAVSFRRIPRRYAAALLASWALYLMLQILRGSHPRCSTAWWALFVVQIAAMLGISVVAVALAAAEQRAKGAANGGGNDDGVVDKAPVAEDDTTIPISNAQCLGRKSATDANGSASNGDAPSAPPAAVGSAADEVVEAAALLVLRAPLATMSTTFLAGIVGGLLGLGGGMVMGPLMLHLGVHPQVTAATSGAMVLFSSSSALTQFALLHRLNAPYAGFFGGASLVAGLAGTHAVARAVRHSGRPSLVVLALAGVMAAGALSVGSFG